MARGYLLEGADMDPRTAWVYSMRARFSPPAMLFADGSIRQEYFKPKQVVLVDEKKWGMEERELLYQGLERYGVGRWREISEELLPSWDEQAIRVKAARLLGSQSLARYAGWKGDRAAADVDQARNRVIGEKTGCWNAHLCMAAVDAEHAANRAIGEETGCWKTGVLVEDDDGSVAKALAAQGSAGR